MDNAAGLVITILGIVSVSAVSLPYFNRQRNREVISLLKEERDAYKQALEDQEVRCQNQINDCNKEIAKLKGRVEFLADGFANTVADKVAERVIEVVNG